MEVIWPLHLHCWYGPVAEGGRRWTLGIGERRICRRPPRYVEIIARLVKKTNRA